MYKTYLGDFLLKQDNTLIGSDSILTVGGVTLSVPSVVVNSSRKSDGTITAIIINKNLSDSTNLKIFLSGYSSSYDSIRAKSIYGEYDAWESLMDSVFASDSNFAHSIFIHNNWPLIYKRFNLESPYREFVSMHELDSCHAYRIGTTDTFGVWLPKHSISAVQIFPSSDTFDIVLSAGWNLISIPVFTDMKLKDIFSADTLRLSDSLVYAINRTDTTDRKYMRHYRINRYDPYKFFFLPLASGYFPINDQWRYISCLDSVPKPGCGYFVYSDTQDPYA
jgi:hypothetical protein